MGQEEQDHTGEYQERQGPLQVQEAGHQQEGGIGWVGAQRGSALNR